MLETPKGQKKAVRIERRQERKLARINAGMGQKKQQRIARKNLAYTYFGFGGRQGL